MDNFDLSASHAEQSVVAYQSFSSDSPVVGTERPERLHEWLKSEEIEYLHRRFVDKGQLTYTDLRKELEALNIIFTDVEFNRLFLKINQNRDFKCDWNEFISYLIFGFQEDDPSSRKEALILPISEAPTVKKSEHRSPICAIGMISTTSDLFDDAEENKRKNLLEANEETDEEAEADEEKTKLQNLAINDTPSNTGIWVTASKEGQIRFWTPQLEPLRTGNSQSCKLIIILNHFLMPCFQLFHLLY